MAILKADGHISTPEALSTFNLALSLRSAAPRIEAHYQYYTTGVAPHLSSSSDEQCDPWVLIDGKQFCSPSADESNAKTIENLYVNCYATKCNPLTSPGLLKIYPSTMFLGLGKMPSCMPTSRPLDSVPSTRALANRPKPARSHTGFVTEGLLATPPSLCQ